MVLPFALLYAVILTQLRARFAKLSLYFGQLRSVSGSKSAPFGHTSVFASGPNCTWLKISKSRHRPLLAGVLL
jgi:hypothetical protein